MCNETNAPPPAGPLSPSQKARLREQFRLWYVDMPGPEALVEALLDLLPDDKLKDFIEARMGDVEEDLDIRYRCPACGHKWEETYGSACDSECPACGLKNITALMYKTVDGDWTADEEAEWEKEPDADDREPDNTAAVEGCYYNDPEHCRGELWECLTCHERYCEGHNHVTDKGRNVECVACEGLRREKRKGKK